MRTFPFLVLCALASCSKGQHSPEEVCKHVGKFMPGGGGQAECVADMGKLKQQLGESKYGEISRCFMKATNKEAVGACGMQAVSVDDMKTYANKSKAIEAKMMTRRMADSARVFYMSPGFDESTMMEVAPSLPDSVGPTPPKGACCEGEGERCAPSATDWQHPSWLKLEFEVIDPHYYSYEFKRDADGKTFTALAYGDLDCDGTFSTYTTTGTWDETQEMHSLSESADQELE